MDIMLIVIIVIIVFVLFLCISTSNNTKHKEKNINDYDITKIQMVVNKQDNNYIEYFITNIDDDLLKNKLLLFEYITDNNINYIKVKNRKTEEIIYSHILPDNIQLLKNAISNNIGYKNGYFNTEIMFGFIGIPHWKREYFYKEDIFYNYGSDNKRIPKHCKKFYEIFKREFLNENFIELNGETNYSFYLMFDLLKSKQENLTKHLLNLMKNYPEVTPYCEEEMGKLGLTCREYKNKNYLKCGHNTYIVENNFPNKQEIIEWTNGDFFKHTGVSVYIDDNGVINVVEDKTIALYGNEKRGCRVFPLEGSLPIYIKFGEVDGYFKFVNCIWSSEKNRNNNYQGGEMTVEKVISLEGSPNIVNGNFICENLGLTSLIGGPRIVHGDYICKNNAITSFIGIPEKIEGCFNFSNNELTDDAWDYCKNNIDGEINDYKHNGNKFVKYRKELEFN